MKTLQRGVVQNRLHWPAHLLHGDWHDGGWKGRKLRVEGVGEVSVGVKRERASWGAAGVVEEPDWFQNRWVQVGVGCPHEQQHHWHPRSGRLHCQVWPWSGLAQRGFSVMLRASWMPAAAASSAALAPPRAPQKSWT